VNIEITFTNLDNSEQGRYNIRLYIYKSIYDKAEDFKNSVMGLGDITIISHITYPLIETKTLFNEIHTLSDIYKKESLIERDNFIIELQETIDKIINNETKIILRENIKEMKNE